VYSLAKPFLFRLDAEQAHGLGLKAIEAAYRAGLNPLLAAKPPGPAMEGSRRTTLFGGDAPERSMRVSAPVSP